MEMTRMESLCRRINEGAVTVSHGQVQGGFERIRVALKDFVTDENLMCQRTLPPHDIHRKDLRIAPLRQHKQQGTLGSAFLCPFVVDPNASQDCFPGVLGVAYFNMAVAMHIIAAQAPGRQASHFMKQARTLYLKGHEYLEEDPSMIQLDGTLVYAYIAICNNMIELELDFGGTADEWVEALDSTVAAMPENSGSAVYQYFQLRSACLMLPSQTAAEAA